VESWITEVGSLWCDFLDSIGAFGLAPHACQVFNLTSTGYDVVIGFTILFAAAALLLLERRL